MVTVRWWYTVEMDIKKDQNFNLAGTNLLNIRSFPEEAIFR